MDTDNINKSISNIESNLSHMSTMVQDCNRMLTHILNNIHLIQLPNKTKNIKILGG
jgi:hypothetical protein